MKEFFEKLEGMMEKPSDYLKWTEDQFVEAVKSINFYFMLEMLLDQKADRRHERRGYSIH